MPDHRPPADSSRSGHGRPRRRWLASIARTLPALVLAVAAVATVAPSMSVTNRAPQVAGAPIDGLRPIVAAQAPSTSIGSTTSAGGPGTTASLLVDGEQPVTTEAVATDAVVEPDGISSSTKLSLIVAMLVAMALIIGTLTVVYWRKTRPYEWEEWEEPENDADDDGDARDDDVAPPTPVGATRAAPPRRAGQVAAASGAASRRNPEPAAPVPAPPIVPSLIDPDLRARLGTPAPDAGDRASDEPVGPPRGDDHAAGTDAPTRWGTGRRE